MAGLGEDINVKVTFVNFPIIAAYYDNGLLCSLVDQLNFFILFTSLRYALSEAVPLRGAGG